MCVCVYVCACVCVYVRASSLVLLSGIFLYTSFHPEYMWVSFLESLFTYTRQNIYKYVYLGACYKHR